MADRKHLNLMKQGAKIWNKWRDEHPSIIPALQNINFREIYQNEERIQDFNLRGANLRRANLSGMDLSGVDFMGADLSGADLAGANLKKADFVWCCLQGANLSKAVLHGASLTYADLKNANLRETDLSNARMCGVTLDNADLSRADLTGANLENTEYQQRSTSLVGTNLHGANLTQARIEGSLQNAILTKTICCKTTFDTLRQANLCEADLREAHLPHDLTEADLQGAILSKVDLRGRDLSGANLSKADLREARLGGAILSYTNFCEADMREAVLSGSIYRKEFGWHFTPEIFTQESSTSSYDMPNGVLYTIFKDTDFSKANLSRAVLKQMKLEGAKFCCTNLRGADLSNADLSRTDLSGADLSGANLIFADLLETNLEHANLSGCFIYGIAVWNIHVYGAIQANLIITRQNEAVITIDNLEVAQFIYLLLNNQKIRHVIDTIISKVVLILGCFTDEREKILEALRDELRGQNYLPVVFNFEGAANKDFTETVRTLANMARFVLIDLTGLDDTLREIADAVVPRCVVPIQPLLLLGEHRQGYELFRELQQKHRWVLAPYRYKDLLDLHSIFQEKIIQLVDEKIIELKQKKPLKTFIGYAPEDKGMLNKLKTHLRLLERAGLIELWDDQNLVPGEEKGKEIEKQLSNARIILLLISPDFLISHDCYDIQMGMAIERHKQGKARVIPILLRPCAWHSTPLRELQPLPKDSKPISKHDKDDAFFEVSEEIGEVVKALRQ